MRELMFAISSSVFATIFLGSVIMFGGDVARDVAILASLFGCYSQFCGQDQAAYKLSIYCAYFAFVLALFSYLALVTGH